MDAPGENRSERCPREDRCVREQRRTVGRDIEDRLAGHGDADGNDQKGPGLPGEYLAGKTESEAA